MAEKTLYNTQNKKAVREIELENTKQELMEALDIRDMPLCHGEDDDVKWLTSRFRDMDASRPDDDWDLRRDQYIAATVWREDGLANVNLKLEQATIQNKKADMMSAKTIVNLHAQERDDIYKKELLREIWDFVWAEADTEKEKGKLFDTALCYGSAWWYEGLHKETITRYQPKQGKDGTITSKAVTQTRSWLRGRVLDIRDVWIDPVQDIEDAVDCFIRMPFYTADTLQGLLEDPNYDHEAVKEFVVWGADQENASRRNDSSYTFLTREELIDTTRGKYTLFEYYNKEKGMYIVLGGMGGEFFPKPLRKGVNPYPHGELPISLMIDHPRPEELYGIGECELLEGTKYERNSLRNQMLDKVRTSNTDNLLVGDTVSFEDSELIEGITRVFNVSGDINQAKYLQSPGMDSGLMNMEELFRGDGTWITGIDVNAIAGYESKTAFEARLQEQNKLKRIMNTMTHFDFFMQRVARQRLANIQYFLPITTGKKLVSVDKENKAFRVIPVENKKRVDVRAVDKKGKVEDKSVKFESKEGFTEFLELTPKMLQNNLDVSVSTPTTTPILKELDRMDLREVLNNIVQLAQIDPEVIQKFKSENYIEEMFEQIGFSAERFIEMGEEDEAKKVKEEFMKMLPGAFQPRNVDAYQGQRAEALNDISPAKIPTEQPLSPTSPMQQSPNQMM